MRGKFFMKKIKLLLSAAAVALVAMFTLAPAVQAQTVAELVADPIFVEAGGEQTFAMTGSGWPANGQVALLPCDDAKDYAQAAELGQAACDLGSLTIVTTDGDGNLAADFTHNVPAEGFCIGAGTLDSSYVGTFCVGVGAPILPNSGSESAMVAIIGAAVLAGGAMIVLSTRRRSFVS